MKKIFLAASAALLLIACQKEVSIDTGTVSGGTSGGTVGGGTTGGGTTGGNSSNDYQPVTANSKWNMKSSTLGDYTLTSLGTDTMVSGKKFYAFNNSVGGRQYISKNNGEYRQFANAPQAGGWVNLLYLKDASVGTTWTETLSNAQGVAVLMKYTVVSTGGTRTVNNKLYNNVIKLTYEQSAMGFSTGNGEQWFAKGVGPIESIARADLLGMVTALDSTYLVSSVIN